MTMEMQRSAVAKTVANKKKRGFTLTEIAIVLGIVGLILGAIWVAAAAVYTNLRTSKTSTELLTIVQNLRAMYATSGTVDSGADISTFGTLSAGQLTYIRSGVFPADMLNGTDSAATTVSNPWNGYVAVTSAQGTVASDSFAVEFQNVPVDACISLLSSTTGTGRDPGMIGVTVGTAALATGGTTTPATQNLPVTASTARTLCTNTQNVLSFFFKLK